MGAELAKMRGQRGKKIFDGIGRGGGSCIVLSSLAKSVFVQL